MSDDRSRRGRPSVRLPNHRHLNAHTITICLDSVCAKLVWSLDRGQPSSATNGTSAGSYSRNASISRSWTRFGSAPCRSCSSISSVGIPEGRSL